MQAHRKSLRINYLQRAKCRPPIGSFGVRFWEQIERCRTTDSSILFGPRLSVALFQSLTTAAGRWSELLELMVAEVANGQAILIDRVRESGCAPIFENGIDRIDWIAVDDTLARINDAGNAALGGLAKQLTGLPWIDLWAFDTRSLVASHLALAKVNGSTRFSAASDLGGCRLWWDVVLSVAADGLIAQARDVSDTLATMDEYRLRSRQDALTGLLNRAALRDTLTLEIGRSDSTGCAGAVLMLDLDNFKLINDTLGHDVGDQILQAVADGLRDVVDDKGFSARLGGDEFTVVLPGVGNLDDLRGVAEALLERLGRAVHTKSRVVIRAPA